MGNVLISRSEPEFQLLRVDAGIHESDQVEVSQDFVLLGTRIADVCEQGSLPVSHSVTSATHKCQHGGETRIVIPAWNDRQVDGPALQVRTDEAPRASCRSSRRMALTNGCT